MGGKPCNHETVIETEFFLENSVSVARFLNMSEIVYPDIAQGTEFAFDDGSYFLGNTSYLLPTKEMWILGLLNSKAVFWFYTKTSTQIWGGFVRFIAQYVSQIPIPSIKPAQKAAISKLVNQILDAKRTNPDATVSDLENEIDQIVYLLYGLTPEEIKIVEEAENV